MKQKKKVDKYKGKLSFNVKKFIIKNQSKCQIIKLYHLAYKVILDSEDK